MNLIILIILIILLVGALPTYPYSRNWGYSPVSILVIVLIIFLLFGHK